MTTQAPGHAGPDDRAGPAGHTEPDGSTEAGGHAGPGRSGEGFRAEWVGPLGGLVLLVVGITCLRLVQTGAYTSYVRVGMRVPLLAAGALVALLGVVALVRYARSGGHDDHPAEAAVKGSPENAPAATAGAGDPGQSGHHRHGLPRVAALLLLPAAVAYLVAPPSLGAFSAARATVTVPAPRALPYAPLKPGPDGTVTLPLREVVERAYDGRTLAGQTLRVTGFVVSPAGGRLTLTRFVIRCCAADAEPAAVNLTLPPGVETPAENAWITVLAR
ncbi:TIGR03943 family putative permease subunit, partial [Pseudofrankia sp. BMG5.37]|uniref:TIGR03943 family putative permease subunit n=1 Tax=Pseudofrankia sp. BMG5.37 TaxID=3050035 RepID=UPI002894C13B